MNRSKSAGGMANQKAPSDVSVGAVLLLRKATGAKKTKGEDLIADPKLRKAYIAAKKRAKAQKP